MSTTAPSYPDLGKTCRTLFERGYFFGLWKLVTDTKTNKDIDLHTCGFSNEGDGVVSGSVQGRYHIPDHGLTLTERWKTDNSFFTELASKNTFTEGLKGALGVLYNKDSGDTKGMFSIGYGHENFQIDADTSVDELNKGCNFSAVLAFKEFLFGYKSGFDFAINELKAHRLACGYLHENFILHLETQNFEGFNGSIFHKAADHFDVGLQAGRSVSLVGEEGGESEYTFGLACRYALEGDAIIRAKINNKAHIGLGYQQVISTGLTFFISGLIDAQNIKEGDHKLGVAFEIAVSAGDAEH